MSETLPAPAPINVVPAEIHYGLQAEFVRLAAALGVEIKNGTTFAEGLAQCHKRATIAAAKANQYDAVLSLLDGAEDALRYALCMEQVTPEAMADLARTSRNLQRALPLLRELANKKP